MLDAVPVILGIVMIIGSIRNDDWLISPTGSRDIIAKFFYMCWGRNAVRIYYICLALLLIGLGSS